MGPCTPLIGIQIILAACIKHPRTWWLMVGSDPGKLPLGPQEGVQARTGQEQLWLTTMGHGELSLAWGLLNQPVWCSNKITGTILVMWGVLHSF